MTIYWMLNSHWPSFFGNIFDYYLRPGGAYYGAKTGLRPLTAVFDSYATGDHSQANVTAVNQTPHDEAGLRVRVRVYDLQGRVRDDQTSQPVNVPSGGAAPAMTLPRMARDSRVFFVRCELLGSAGNVLSENVYWQSQRNDDVGDPDGDFAFQSNQASWADMTALNYMTRVPLDVTATRSRPTAPGRTPSTSGCTTPPSRSRSSNGRRSPRTDDGDEILPIEYYDNYVTVFPGETVDLDAVVPSPLVTANWVRVTGTTRSAGDGADHVVVPVQPAQPPRRGHQHAVTNASRYAAGSHTSHAPPGRIDSSPVSGVSPATETNQPANVAHDAHIAASDHRLPITHGAVSEVNHQRRQPHPVVAPTERRCGGRRHADDRDGEHPVARVATPASRSPRPPARARRPPRSPRRPASADE